MRSYKKLFSIILLVCMLSSLFASVIPTLVSAEGVSTAPAATNTASEITVTWSKGYVGSRTNSDGKNKIVASATSTYRYSDVIIIPKAGTKIYFTDPESSYASTGAYAFSEWKASGSTYVLDAVEGTHVLGTASYDGIGSKNTSSGQEYEYITHKDNQAIRICYLEATQSTPSKIYQVLTTDKSTKEQQADCNFTETFNADGTISGIQWFCGYASSRTNTNGSAKETKPHSTDYLHSGFIRIPEAGTTVTFSLSSTHTPNDAFNGITTYQKQGDAYVYLDGCHGLDTTIYSVSGNTRTYTYTSAKDGEVIRVCFKISTNGDYFQPTANVTAKWEKSDKQPTLSGEGPSFTWPEPEILSLVTGAKLIGKEIELEWHDGYIGSQYHGSAPFQITSPSNVEYDYSDVFTVPKAGTTVYFFDQTYTDYKGSQYASTSVMTVSHWKKQGYYWVFDKDKEYLDGCRAYSIIMNDDYRVYAYTTTEDNENLRLCMRYCPSDDRLEEPIPPVFLVEPTDFVAKAEQTGKFFASSYTDQDGKSASFEVYLPEGYTPEKQYTLIFDNSADGAVSDMLAKCKYTGIIVKCKESGDRLFRVLDEVVAKYPVNVADILFIGGDEIYEHVKKYERLRLAQALLYTGSDDAKLEFASVKKLSDTQNALEAAEWIASQGECYYDLLEGLTFYAIGDSYFGGSGIGQHQTWVNMLGNKYDMTYINYGLGGNTVATYSGISANSPAMAYRYTMMPTDGDIYFIEGGRNDRGKGVPFGTNTDMKPSTFKGALNTMIKSIREKSPDALIILVTPWSYVGQNPSNNDYADAMKELETHYNDKHIICMYAADSKWTGLEMGSAAIRKKYCLTESDVSHLNVNGMNMIFPKFEKWIAEKYSAFSGKTLTDTSTLTKLDSSLANAPEETTPPPVIDTVPETTTQIEEKGCGSLLSSSAVILLAVCASYVFSKKSK